jgi:hypothetical protein
LDPCILCHEDSDFNDRIMHRLRQKGQQLCLFAATDLFGYHLNHPASVLYDASLQSKAILEPRRVRLLSDPTSTEGLLPTKLDSIDALRQDLYATQPPLKIKVKARSGLLKRVRRAANSIIRD